MGSHPPKKAFTPSSSRTSGNVPIIPVPYTARFGTFVLRDDDGRQEARERCATHLMQQSTHADSCGGEETREGTIVGDRMTEKGRGGGDLVETFELHKITSLPYFRTPKSRERTGTYSTCVLSVWLHCQRHGQLVFQAQSEGWLTGVTSIFSYLGIFCNFNIIFTLS